MRFWLVWVVGIGLAAPAWAHEFWIAPSRYRAAAGDTVAVRVCAGTGFRGEIKPYAPSRVVRFSLRNARDLDLTRAASNGDLVMARFIAPDGGGALVSYESNFADIELPAAEFDRYLQIEGLDAVRATRAKAPASVAGRERYARCAKSWIGGTDASRATRPVGLTYELVPLSVPGATGSLTVRASFHGRVLAGALVRAWNRPLSSGSQPFDAATRDSVPPAFETRTNTGGLATIPLGHPGEWLISSVHMVPSADREEADWESYWASVTFAKTGE